MSPIPTASRDYAPFPSCPPPSHLYDLVTGSNFGGGSAGRGSRQPSTSPTVGAPPPLTQAPAASVPAPPGGVPVLSLVALPPAPPLAGATAPVSVTQAGAATARPDFSNLNSLQNQLAALINERRSATSAAVSHRAIFGYPAGTRNDNTAQLRSPSQQHVLAAAHALLRDNPLPS